MKNNDKFYPPPIIPETSEVKRVMWKQAKKKIANFAHIKVSVSGKTDICECLICLKQVQLETQERSRQSIMLETARLHYYKHKLDLKAVEEKVKK